MVKKGLKQGVKSNRQDKGKGGGGDPSILSGANQTIRNGWIVIIQ
ncbi:hypothetical protein HMPREF1398_00788 [Helicobacter pylori GAM117Ai]|nr:hypothetical protein HMPREF1398_00788 [Helicobacter pylori GAM117Ai]